MRFDLSTCYFALISNTFIVLALTFIRPYKDLASISFAATTTHTHNRPSYRQRHDVDTFSCWPFWRLLFADRQAGHASFTTGNNWATKTHHRQLGQPEIKRELLPGQRTQLVVEFRSHLQECRQDPAA